MLDLDTLNTISAQSASATQRRIQENVRLAYQVVSVPKLPPDPTSDDKIRFANDVFAVFGCTPEVLKNPKELRYFYRRCALRIHPDRDENKEIKLLASDALLNLNAAYKILQSPRPEPKKDNERNYKKGVADILDMVHLQLFPIIKGNKEMRARFAADNTQKTEPEYNTFQDFATAFVGRSGAIDLTSLKPELLEILNAFVQQNHSFCVTLCTESEFLLTECDANRLDKNFKTHLYLELQLTMFYLLGGDCLDSDLAKQLRGLCSGNNSITLSRAYDSACKLSKSDSSPVEESPALFFFELALEHFEKHWLPILSGPLLGDAARYDPDGKLPVVPYVKPGFRSDIPTATSTNTATSPKPDATSASSTASTTFSTASTSNATSPAPEFTDQPADIMNPAATSHRWSWFTTLVNWVREGLHWLFSGQNPPYPPIAQHLVGTTTAAAAAPTATASADDHTTASPSTRGSNLPTIQ